jgi:hypothetical protein
MDSFASEANWGSAGGLRVVTAMLTIYTAKINGAQISGLVPMWCGS